MLSTSLSTIASRGTCLTWKLSTRRASIGNAASASALLLPPWLSGVCGSRNVKVFIHSGNPRLASGRGSGRSDVYPQRVSIGAAYKDVHKPKNPHLVPLLYYDGALTQTDLAHLQWILKKDLLSQDVFLMGPPGSTRRHLAMLFAELTSREIEYVALSRDTAESDLKQRREVIGKTAQYFDQSAVRAATQGRLLIIEGIEKAERNVLPLLNNLLENREMQLEDGRHLIGATRYDKLLQEHGREKVELWKLVRVHEDFRVIALGLPVPFFKGNPLDPPLRSRFQGRSIVPLTNQEMLERLKALAPNAPPDKLETLTNFAYSVVWSNDPDFRESEENPWAITLPHFPLENLCDAARLLNVRPGMSLYRLLLRLYPYGLLLETSKEGVEVSAVDEILRKSGFRIDALPKGGEMLVNPKSAEGVNKYVSIASQEGVVREMLESHGIGRDVCLIGEKGSGKSVVVARFADALGAKVEPIVLHKDMTGRDLLQQRSTKKDGDTVWVNSPLVRAAVEGKVALLDGIDQLHPSTLAIIHRLVHDRELQLHDGTRLLRGDRYDALKTKHAYSEEALRSLGIFRIHADFYIVATATPPVGGGNAQAQKQWLTPELLAFFLYHQLPPMSLEEELRVIDSFCSTGSGVGEDMEKILKTARALRQSAEASRKALGASLSTRQLIRIARRNEKFGAVDTQHGPFEEISRACLVRFLPQLNKEELESTMMGHGIHPNRPTAQTEEKRIEVCGNTLRIGRTTAEVWSDSGFKSKVPHVLFYGIQQHVAALEDLLRDYLLNQHLLLVGNQGVGKNKLVDQLLFLLNRPREYIQLHRDTTVQSLTVQQKVTSGVVSFEDSPLVRAAREGHVIIIDEADKAPTHVTSILKTLAERGEMILSDNRRIVPNAIFEEHYKHLSAEELREIIPLHSHFRMFVLANRPGFPFLGNDFYSVLGDLFSVHAIDNPSFESEVALLKNYAPSVPSETLERIAKAFGDLRKLSDDGTISYPYSTREAVHIVKHLEKYPHDTLSQAIDNVFDFDVYDHELRKRVRRTLKKHKLEPTEGILLRRRYTDEGELGVRTLPLAELSASEREGALNPLRFTDKTFKDADFGGPKHGRVDSTGGAHVGGNTWAGGSGGRDTAGLGGVGGPYRLDSGNPVFQVSDAVKQALSPEARKLARAMAQKAFEEKLREMKMSKYEGSVYEEYLAPIRPQIGALRVILSSLQAKAKERKWVRHQTSGELDDTKIIESVVGEKNVYRRRQEENPEPGDPQQKPKRLRLVVDVSGSMYRFNGYDRRLDRMLGCALLLMEAFQGFEEMFQYDIVGHSGDDYKVPVVEGGKEPKDNKERLDVMRLMHLHSQFCSSGDNTLEATGDAVAALAAHSDDFDESFVVVLSDANLERYGIPPKELGKLLTSSDDVKAFAVFIGSLGDQAERLKRELPPGKAYVCLDTTKLPQILQRIFSETILA